MKDGYSPEWGFSIFDVLSGSLGGFYPMAKRYVQVSIILTSNGATGKTRCLIINKAGQMFLLMIM
jgi:hypothetical protein